MGRVRHRLDDFGESRRPADPLKVALRAEPLVNDRDVDSLAGIVQLEQVAVEKLVRVVRKVLRPHDKRDIVADIGLEQDASEDRPLGIDVGGTITTVGHGSGRAAEGLVRRPARTAAGVATTSLS